MTRDSNVIGIDIAKRVFHVIGMDTRGTIILRKRLYLGMEACGGHTIRRGSCASKGMRSN
jgi:transposase